MSEQPQRELSLRELVERSGNNRAKKEYESLMTVLLDFAIRQACEHSRIAGLWTDDAHRALLDAYVPGQWRG